MNRHLATLSGVFLVMLVASGCATRTAPSLASSMPAADPADFETQLNEYGHEDKVGVIRSEAPCVTANLFC